MRKTALIAFVLSLVLTVACAIAQASYDVYDSAAVPFATPATDFPDWPESPADESLIAYTQALANCAYLQADVSDASWEVVSSAGGYSVFAAVEDGERYTFVYLPDGRLAAYQTAGALPPVSQRLLPQEGFGDELASYALSFLDAVSPSVSNGLEAFTEIELANHEGVVTGSLCALTYTTGSRHDGASFVIELEPVARMVSYRLKPAMLQHLWSGSLLSRREPSFSVLGASAGEADLLVPEALLPAAKEYLKERYGETDASLGRFDIECELLQDEPSLWFFRFVCCTAGDSYLDHYQVWADAQTGEIVDAAAAEEGKG